MKNEAQKVTQNEITLFSGGEAAEDLIYEFLKDRSSLTERAYKRGLKAFFEFTAVPFSLPRSIQGKLLFEEIRRVHVVKYKKYLDEYLSNRKKAYAPNTINRKISAVSSYEIFTSKVHRRRLFAPPRFRKANGSFYQAKYKKLRYQLGSHNKAVVAIANRIARAISKSAQDLLGFHSCWSLLPLWYRFWGSGPRSLFYSKF